MRDEEERGQGADYEKLVRCIEETRQELSATRAALEESMQQIAAFADKNKEIALQVEGHSELLKELGPTDAFLFRWNFWFVPVNIGFWLHFAWTGQPPSFFGVVTLFILAPLTAWLNQRLGNLGSLVRADATASQTERSGDDDRTDPDDEDTKRKQSRS